MRAVFNEGNRGEWRLNPNDVFLYQFCSHNSSPTSFQTIFLLGERADFQPVFKLVPEPVFYCGKGQISNQFSTVGKDRSPTSFSPFHTVIFTPDLATQYQGFFHPRSQSQRYNYSLTISISTFSLPATSIREPNSLNLDIINLLPCNLNIMPISVSSLFHFFDIIRISDFTNFYGVFLPPKSTIAISLLVRALNLNPSAYSGNSILMPFQNQNGHNTICISRPSCNLNFMFFFKDIPSKQNIVVS